MTRPEYEPILGYLLARANADIEVTIDEVGSYAYLQARPRGLRAAHEARERAQARARELIVVGRKGEPIR